MQYEQISATAFEKMQLGAGILLSSFTPATPTVTDTAILGATTGGISASCVFTTKDMGDTVDNCPKNMLELKANDTVECKIGGTFVTIDTTALKLMLGSADIDGTDTTLVTPRMDLTDADFTDVWFVGDYSDENSGTTAGFVAIHLMNALNTAGFAMKTADSDIGQFTVDFLGHFSMDAQDTVPMEFYISTGTAAV